MSAQERSAESGMSERQMLAELFALVQGECPSLLDEDSGGDARLCIAIEEALASPAPAAEVGELPPAVEWEMLDGTDRTTDPARAKNWAANVGVRVVRRAAALKARPAPAADHRVEDLAALVRQLVHAQRKAAPENKL